MEQVRIQDKVLKELWKTKDEMKVKYLVENTNFNRTQIYQALRRLKDRGLISSRIEYPGNGRVDNRVLIVKLKNIRHAEIILERKDLI